MPQKFDAEAKRFLELGLEWAPGMAYWFPRYKQSPGRARLVEHNGIVWRALDPEESAYSMAVHVFGKMDGCDPDLNDRATVLLIQEWMVNLWLAKLKPYYNYSRVDVVAVYDGRAFVEVSSGHKDIAITRAAIHHTTRPEVCTNNDRLCCPLRVHAVLQAAEAAHRWAPEEDA